MPTLLSIDPLRFPGTDPAVQIAADADRAFPRSQELLAFTGRRRIPGPLTVTWHDLGLSSFRGAFAYLNDTRADMQDLLGTVIRLTVSARSVLVYVIGSDLIEADVSLSRRAYLALAPLSADPLLALAEVVRER